MLKSVAISSRAGHRSGDVQEVLWIVRFDGCPESFPRLLKLLPKVLGSNFRLPLFLAVSCKWIKRIAKRAGKCRIRLFSSGLTRSNRVSLDVFGTKRSLVRIQSPRFAEGE
jgi:hypothetical protein